MSGKKWSFSSKRTKCPSCEARHGWSEIRGSPGKGKCFACGLLRLPGQSDWVETPPVSSKLKLVQPPTPVPTEQSMPSLVRAHKNQQHPFIKLMHALIDWQTERCTWTLGLDPDGGVLFWYRDYEGTIWNAKKVRYGLDGFHRDKSRYPFMIYGGNPVPLFGENHLRSQPWSRVCLVESEKTAIIMSAQYPECVWLATGGSQGLTEERAKHLKGRDVDIIMDNDDAGCAGALLTYRVLAKVGARTARIMEIGGEPGWDPADHVYHKYVQDPTNPQFVIPHS